MVFGHKKSKILSPKTVNLPQIFHNFGAIISLVFTLTTHMNFYLSEFRQYFVAFNQSRDRIILYFYNYNFLLC